MAKDLDGTGVMRSLAQNASAQAERTMPKFCSRSYVLSSQGALVNTFGTAAYLTYTLEQLKYGRLQHLETTEFQRRESCGGIDTELFF